MKKFVDKTKNGKENSVKKLNNLPKNESTFAVSWFSNKSITPGNTVSITDISMLIPENSNPSALTGNYTNSKIYYANEIGVLEDANGNTLFNSDNLSISDLFLSEQTMDRQYTVSDVESKNFVHSYYISRYYTLLDSNSYSINGIEDYVPTQNLPTSISVIDSNGQDYIDPITRAKKYRILLQPINVDGLQKSNKKPYSIIVLMDENSPKRTYFNIW